MMNGLHGNPSGIDGFVVTDESGAVAFSIGVGADPRVLSLVAELAWRREAGARRLQSLVLDRVSYALLVLQFGSSGQLVVLSRCPDPVLDFLGSVEFGYDLLEHLLTDPFDAMTVVDAEARVVYVSPVHERFFGLARGEANGRPVRQVIENTRLPQVVASGKAEIGQIQRMRGQERVVSRIPIKRADKVIGAVGRVMFKGPEQVEALGRRIKALESEVEFYRRAAATLRKRTYSLDDIVGDSPAMRRLKAEITKVAPLDMAVLIQGESGTGKELVAQALHQLSPRRASALVMINGAALPPNLIESELFGYEPSAFTGADRKGRKGKFEQAAEGTIFIDEIGDMPLDVQAKLLRVLQDRVVERIGGERPRQVDFRLITASNRSLEDLVGEKSFRLDLFYRISPIVLRVPPLRERPEDIPQLALHFLREIADRHAQPVPTIDASALAVLAGQPWPGNARQLRHEIERAFVFAETDVIMIDDLARRRHDSPALADALVAATRPPPPPPRARPRSLRNAVGRTERDLVAATMVQFRGNKKRVAAELGISRTYLYKLLAEREG